MSLINLFPTLRSQPLSRVLRDSRPLWTTLDAFGDILADSDYGFAHDRFDASETDAAYTFTIPLPGFKKGDVEVEVEEETYLTVRASRGDGKVEGSEVKTGHSVSRTITLPSDADATKVEAKLEDGLLTISIAKTPEAKPRKVTVS